MSDQDRISPYNIKQISDENKEKYQLGDNKLIQCQTNITRTVWQTVRRITNEILGVKGLKQMDAQLLRERERNAIRSSGYLLLMPFT